MDGVEMQQAAQLLDGIDCDEEEEEEEEEEEDIESSTGSSSGEDGEDVEVELDPALRRKGVAHLTSTDHLAPYVPLLSFEPLQGDVVLRRGNEPGSDEYFDRMLARVEPNVSPEIVHGLTDRWVLRRSRQRHYEFHRIVRRIVSMFKPVVAMGVIVTVYVLAVIAKAEDDENATLPIRDSLPYRDSAGDSTATLVRGSLLNASIVLAAIVAVTLLVLCVLRIGRLRLLDRLLRVLSVVLLTLPWGWMLFQLVFLYRWTVDWVSFVLVLANFAAVGYYGICHVAIDHYANSNSYLGSTFVVLLAAGISWFFAELQETSLWATLILLTVYDLVAVLLPCGPLQSIMASDVNREPFHPETFPGLMYRGEYFMLGLGDLIFFSVLIGRAAAKDWLTLTTCTLAVLVGLAATVIWVSYSKARALPALPISIGLGLVMYFAVPGVVWPFVHAQMDVFAPG